MAFLEHRCSKCGLEQLAFDKEAPYKLPSNSEGCDHNWIALQPIASIIHCSEMYLRVVLDSINSIKALCTKITADAKEQNELKAYLEMKKNL